MRYRLDPGGQEVALTKQDFVASGGEGSVYARGTTAYKVYAQPSHVSRARLAALSRLRVPRAVLPQQLLLGPDHRVAGFTMPWLPDHLPLARLLTRAYRHRHGVDPRTALHLVHALRDAIQQVHQAGALVVDLNENNVLVNARHTRLTLIDTDSWQLPGHPATAIQDSIRDRQSPSFHQGSDWFSFAVLSLHLLLGVHPYRGRHPTVRGLDARMAQRLSILRPEVRVPPVAWPLSVVPRTWLAWYRRVLDGGERLPPPAPEATPTWEPAAQPTSTSRLKVSPILRSTRPILTAREHNGRTATTTAAGEHLLFTDQGGPILAQILQGELHLQPTDGGQPVRTNLRATALTTVGHHLVALVGDQLLQIDVRQLGRLVPLTKTLATVLPRATHLYPGLAVQSLLGSTWLLLLSSGRCQAVRAPELDGWTVLEAAHHRGVVTLLARSAGQTDRFVYRVGPGATPARELRRLPDVDPGGLDLVVLPTGVCCLWAEGRLELFPSAPGTPGLKVLEDPALHGVTSLVDLGHQLGVVRGAEVLRLSMG